MSEITMQFPIRDTYAGQERLCAVVGQVYSSVVWFWAVPMTAVVTSEIHPAVARALMVAVRHTASHTTFQRRLE